MMRRQPAVKTHGSKVVVSDITADPVFQFFNKYYTPIMLFMCSTLPTIVPVYDAASPGISASSRDVAICMGAQWLLFSKQLCPYVGKHSYNGQARPTENPTVSFFVLYNYHHSFPWDYKTAKLGANGRNSTTGFTEFMAWLGLAYNLKTPSEEIVERMSVNKGDGTGSLWENHHERPNQHQHQRQHHHHHRLFHYDHDLPGYQISLIRSV